MGDGASLDRCCMIHDHRTGTAIDNNLGLALGPANIQALHVCEECHALVAALRRAHLNCPPIQRGGDTRTESCVDRVHNAFGIGKIRAVKLEPDHVVLAQSDRHCALDRRTAGNASHPQMIDLHLATAGGRAEAPDQQVALSHPINLAVGSLERRHQQRAASQASCIAHAGDGHVDKLARLRECRQRSGDHHRRHVPQPQIGARRQVDTHLHEHAGDTLYGKRRLNGLVACAIQPHHQTISKQLVGPDTLDRGEILDAFGLCRADDAAPKPSQGKDQMDFIDYLSMWHLVPLRTAKWS